MRAVPILVLCSAACAAAPSEPRVDAPADGGFVLLPDSGGAACRPNLDGVITRDEVVFAPGVAVRYVTNPLGTAAPVDVRGTDAGQGRRRWDFSSEAGERLSLALAQVSGSWFAEAFTGAQYAARLDPRRPELGVYRASAEAVELLGVAGATPGAGTLVRYESPVAVLRFPLRLGSSWMVQSRTAPDATFENTPVALRDTYAVTVDARGPVRTPAIDFAEALRVRVELTQTSPAGGLRRIQYLWITECYGEIARVTSLDGEVNPEFTMATEYRRLSL